MLTNAEIASQIEDSLAPLRTVVKFYDYGDKLRIRVFDTAGNAVLRVVRKPRVRALRNSRQLACLIGLIQGHLHGKGYDTYAR